MNALTAYFAGLLFSFSLIVAIGAQNAFVLRQGARRNHVKTVIGICAASDLLLIAAGIAGMGAIVRSDSSLLTIIRLVGGALLLAYAALAARRAFQQLELQAEADDGHSRRGVIAAALGFTWLNPAVYLDTLVLLGTVASSHPASRWWFGAGAATASIVWFIALGGAAQLLAPILRRPAAARALELFVAVVMTATAVRTLPI
ncbi:MAG TPA: LysE family transporter [Solirubrobacteraceae bacterium]|jgi:L-lysine exporter family protein LysE/ArgO|nr:LysE family transporter [Solirubrobacteraceae bacterium]